MHVYKMRQKEQAVVGVVPKRKKAETTTSHNLRNLVFHSVSKQPSFVDSKQCQEASLSLYFLSPNWKGLNGRRRCTGAGAGAGKNREVTPYNLADLPSLTHPCPRLLLLFLFGLVYHLGAPQYLIMLTHSYRR